MVIVVTVGTHELPFDRLVQAARELVPLGEVRVQRGSSRVQVPGAVVEDLVPPSVLAGWMTSADVVITHGGPGSLRAAWAAGRVPLVVPRDPAHGEHVDDHQLRFARSLGDRVHRLDDPAGLVQAVRRHREVVQGLQPPSVADRQAELAQAFGELVDGLMRERRSRGRLRHLLRGRRARR